MLIQYVWIIVIGLFLVLASAYLWPDKKNRLEFIEERLKEVELKQRVLTEQKKALEKLATEKEWEEVDKETNK